MNNDGTATRSDLERADERLAGIEAMLDRLSPPITDHDFTERAFHDRCGATRWDGRVCQGERAAHVPPVEKR